MKKSITGVVALLAGAFVAHSQGTVQLGNYLVLSTYIYVSLSVSGHNLGNVGGSTATTTGTPSSDIGNGNDWTVQLYGATGAGDAPASLSPLLNENGLPATANLESGGASGDTLPGTWASADYAEIPGGGNGQTATVQLYAWYNDGGMYTSYSAAAAVPNGAIPTGFSAAANDVTGGSGAPAGTPTTLPSGMGNIVVSSTVPEPSTIALGVMGASAFLLRLRKKQ
jgi:hypothetical protein